MRQEEILKYVKIGLVVVLFMYIGLYIGKHFMCSCIDRDISPELVEEAKEGDKQSQRRIIRMRLRQEDIKDTSDRLMMVLGVVIILLLISVFLFSSKKSIQKSKVYKKVRKSLKY